MENGAIFLNPGNMAASPAYSHGVVVPAGCHIIEIGGQNGVDPGSEDPGDIGGQTAKALENIRSILSEAGTGIESIVSLRINVVEGADLHAGFTSWQNFWSGQGHQPIVTALRVASLVVPGALVEIEARAVVRADGMNGLARDMWADFVMNHPDGKAAGATAAATPGIGAWAFGRGAEMETELADLVVAGTKRATASSFNALLVVGEPVPSVGQYAIVLDGAGTPRCVIRTSSVAIAPLRSVTDEFAYREGEGDRSRDHWLDAHRRFIEAEHDELGIAFSDDVPVVFEEFTVVWPRELADR